LKAILERALNEKTTLGRGDATKAEAGIHHLVDGFAEGDRSARRDLIAISQKLGVDLTQGQSKAIETALAEVLAPDDAALLDDFFRRHARRYITGDRTEDDFPPRTDSAATDSNKSERKAP
jgi:hypothetical protein